MFENILVPLDFTAKNRLALKVARQLAGSAHARLTLLHVIERIEHLSANEVRSFYKQLRTKATGQLAAAEKEVKHSSGRLKRDVLFGSRAEEIVRYAKEKKIDLIVMSSSKPETNDSRSWATVSHVVAVTSPCSTLLVK